MSSTQPNFTKLNGTNYATWSGEMQAWLQSQGVWRIVSGSKTKPDPSEAEALEEWLDKADKASGHLYLMVEPDQRIHFKGITSDPVKMWKALQDVHLQKKPGNRFNAYDDLFSIRKKEDETLQNLMNRVNDAMERIKDLRPASGFDLDKLDEELASMALIRALPQEYNTFASSLLLLDKLDKDPTSSNCFMSRWKFHNVPSPILLQSVILCQSSLFPEMCIVTLHGSLVSPWITA